MANTTGHVRKRQYQPSITNFFNNEDPRSKLPSLPQLPGETQASLLSVGMRVRKSVPEGYKTHKTVGTRGFPFPSSAPQLASTPAFSAPAAGNSRELMPFCGLFKTGGLAAQELPPSSAPAAPQYGLDIEDEEGLPALSMSQHTLGSTQDSFASSVSQDSGTRKRTYEDEAEAETDAFFDEIQSEDDPVPHQPEPIRRIAKMKSHSGTSSMTQVIPSVDGDDFGEAVFLAPMDLDRGDTQ